MRNGYASGLPATSPGAVAVVTALVTQGPLSQGRALPAHGPHDRRGDQGRHPARRRRLRARGRAARPTAAWGARPAGWRSWARRRTSWGSRSPAPRCSACWSTWPGHIRQSTVRSPGSRDVEAVVETIVEITDELCATPEVRERLRGVGIGISGGVDTSGLVSYSHFLGWHGVRLAPHVHARLGLPTTVENDVRALTAGEHWFGAGAGRTVVRRGHDRRRHRLCPLLPGPGPGRGARRLGRARSPPDRGGPAVPLRRHRLPRHDRGHRVDPARRLRSRRHPGRRPGDSGRRGVAATSGPKRSSAPPATRSASASPR